MAGDDVERLQNRLTELAFDVGPVDGYYGPLTRQAVWAYEKLVMGVPRSEATGRVTPEMWDHMQDPFQVAPRRSHGSADHVEIYLPEQVMAIFHADRPVLVAHVSSGQQNPDGTPFEYTDDVTIDTDEYGNPLPEPITKPIKGLAYTPPGVFQAGREVTGERNGPLGTMWDPVYINQGIAIHGANNVPLEPASHGCIRVSRYLGPIVQELIDKGDNVYIWDGKKQPEEQSAKDRQMIWDWLDTSRTTTTSTTTTTTTTLAPTTTAPAATTTQPAATTTVAAATTVAPATTVAATTTVAPSDEL
jgi:peptidoglycan hydrolase-like protein with peptidoglycan-binding domain